MDRLFAKAVVKRTIAFFLMVILITVSIPDTSYAAPFTTKTLGFYFTNVKQPTPPEDGESENGEQDDDTDVTQIIKDHFYFYHVETDEYIYPNDQNLLVNQRGQHVGCYYIEFKNIPIADTIRIYNDDDMIIAEYDNESGCNVYYNIIQYHLDVDGVIYNTIYSFGLPIKVPYDGTEEFLQKDGLVFSGWYDEHGNKLAGAINGYLDTNNMPGYEKTVYAGWTDHIHEWAEELSYNDYIHWYECIAEGQCDIAMRNENKGYGVHSYTGRKVTITEPDCVNKGLERVYCSQDGCNAYKEVAIDAIGHLEDTEWSYNNQFHWHNCLRDDCEEQFTIGMHVMGGWVTVTEATFYEKGLRRRVCFTCGYTQEEEILARVDSHIHDYTREGDVVQQPSCTEKGKKIMHCYEEECQSYIYVDVTNLNHLQGEELLYDEYHHYNECERCSERQNEETHQFGDWILVREATKDVKGLEKRICEVCEYEQTRDIEYIEPPTEEETTEEETTEEVTTEEETTEEETAEEVTTEEETTEEVTTEEVTTEEETTEEVTTEEVTTEETTEEVTTEEETTEEVTTEEVTTEEITTEEETTEELRVEEKPPVDREDNIHADKKEEADEEDKPLGTGDVTPVQMYATVAMIAGLSYVLMMFKDDLGMTEEQKNDIVAKIVKWGKSKSRFKRAIALAIITIVLLYYHAIEKNRYANKRQEILERLS